MHSLTRIWGHRFFRVDATSSTAAVDLELLAYLLIEPLSFQTHEYYYDQNKSRFIDRDRLFDIGAGGAGVPLLLLSSYVPIV